MAEDIPDWAREPAATADEDVPAWAAERPASAAHALESAIDPVARIPEYAAREWQEGLKATGLGQPQGALPVRMRALAGGAQAVTAWPSAIYHSIVGQPAQETTEAGMESAGVPKEYAKPASEVLGRMAETAAGFYTPAGKLPPIPKAPMRMLGTRLTEGMATQDPVKLAFEREAAAGRLGAPAQKAALAGLEEQAPQLAASTETVRQELDPLGRIVAGDPHEAARIVGESTQRRAAASKAGVDYLYKEFRRGGSAEGALDTSVFGGNMGRGIRQELRRGTEPVIISDRQTPSAAEMTNWLNQQPEKLLRDLDIRLPKGQQLAGMDLAMVDQMRKRLSSLRRNAFASGNKEDARAAVGVLDKFDQRIDAAMDAGLFRRPDGSPADPMILQAWKDARAAQADYKATFFRSGREDAVGRAMEKIVGSRGRPGDIPDKIADHLWGSSGIAPNSANVELSRRLLNMYGPESVERAAIRQGLFSRIIEPAEGVTPFTHGKVADRLNTFLKTEMANVAYEPWQRDLLREYAELRRRLSLSETKGISTPQLAGHADFLGRLFASRIANVVGHGIGHMFGFPLAGPILRFGAEKAVQHSKLLRDARQVEQQMGATGRAWDDYAKAVKQFDRLQNARTIARVSIAARNLDHNLRSAGTSLTQMTQQPAPQPVPAQPQQPAPQQDQGPIGESHIY